MHNLQNKRFKRRTIGKIEPVIKKGLKIGVEQMLMTTALSSIHIFRIVRTGAP